MSYSNSFPEESIGAQPTEAYHSMEELRPRQQPQYQQPPYAATTVPQPVADTPPALESVDSVRSQGERQKKKAMTVRFAIDKFNEYLLWFLMVLETVLALRFLLKLIGADPNNLFAGFLYALTSIPLLPFQGIVGSPSIRPPNQSFEFSTLIAIAIYYLIFFALRRFIKLLVSNPEESSE